MNNRRNITWAVSLKENGQLLSGTITHYGKFDIIAHQYDDNLYFKKFGVEGVQNLVMDAILSLIPDGEVTLITPIPGNQDWLPIHNKSRIRLFYEYWFVYSYLDLLKLLKFILRIKNQKFRKHIRNVEKTLNWEAEEDFLKELERDRITMGKEDYKGRCQLRLDKRQLPKYLDSLGEHGGVRDHFDMIAVPKKDGILWEEDDLELFRDNIYSHIQSLTEKERSRIESLMSDHVLIGILDEGFFFFLAHLSDKNDLTARLKKVAVKYNLTIDLKPT